jgi:hypothetical protein
LSFLLFISEMNLMRGVQRWGAVSLMFLTASVVCLPLVWLRHTALEQRLTRLPRIVVLSTLFVVLILSGLMALAYCNAPTRFI